MFSAVPLRRLRARHAPGRAATLAILAFTLQSCGHLGVGGKSAPLGAKLERMSYKEINDTLAAAQDQGGFLIALERACESPRGTDERTKDACAALKQEKPTAETEQQFLRKHFCPYRIAEDEQTLFTGYYTGLMKADLTPSEVYKYPVYALPKDYKEGEPYDERSVIETAGLAGRAQALAYAADPVDLFFLQVQGSGAVEFPDGTTRFLAFAGKNNRPYTAVGKVLIERGVIPREKMNGAALKSWLKANPEQSAEVMRQNASYVFFKWSDESSPRGASGAVLTPEHSLAADPAKLPFGAPALIETRRTRDGLWPERFVRLAVLQDAGSAIKGAKRFDVYFGPGEEAEDYANHQNEGGEVTLFLPDDGEDCQTPGRKWLPSTPRFLSFGKHNNGTE